jgi:hypothetical protein
MIQPLNTNKSSPRSRGGGSLICWQNCWQKQSLHLQADEIPRRPKGSVGMTNGGGGCAGREPNFVGRIVGRSNPLTYKRMRFLVARRAFVGMTSRGGGFEKNLSRLARTTSFFFKGASLPRQSRQKRG